MMPVRPVFSLTIFVLAGALPVRAQFSALPGVVHLAAEDSAEVTVVQVRNEGERTMQFRIYLNDYDQAEDGDYAFHPFGRSAGSCAGRISFYPDDAVLGPGERQDIQVRMEPGPACWGLLFVESAAGEAGQVRIAQRIGVRVLNAPASLSRDGEVAAVQATQADSVAVEVLFRNLGAAPVELRGTVEIRDLGGNAVASAGIGPLGVLPAHARRISVSLPERLAPGQYLAVPILDFGADYLAGGQALFTVH